jgi:amino acid adenylation domain-containing protein
VTTAPAELVAGPALVPIAFERVARAMPSRPAVVDRSGVLTYQELLVLSASIGASTRRAVARAEKSRVGVLLPRSRVAVAAILGVVRSGAAYVPLDPEQPVERLRLVMRDAELACVVSSRELAEAVDPSVPVIYTDDRRSEDLQVADAPRPSDIMYIIYTSGTSGTPKGVSVEHGSVAALLRAGDEFVVQQDRVVWMSQANFIFDMSVFDLFWSLTRGHTLVLTDLMDTIRRLRRAPDRGPFSPTHLECTPTFLAAVLRDSHSGAGLGGLQQILVGGEALPAPVVDMLQALNRVPVLTNVYGPTEATVWALSERVGMRPSPITLGRPITGVHASVVDGDLRPITDGRIGELVIGGAGVARGYWRRPALTARSFVPDPFSARPGSRMYRSGDRVRRLSDGRVEFLGRLDTQIKIRGLRIELEEIDRIICGHPAVAHGAAVLDEHPSAGRRIVAFYTLRNRSTVLSGQELIAYLARRLPPQAVPALAYSVDRIPQNRSAKIDRHALAESLQREPGRSA